MKKRIKLKIYELFDETVIESRLERVIDIFLIVLIFLNVLSVILETEERLFIRFRADFSLVRDRFRPDLHR